MRRSFHAAFTFAAITMLILCASRTEAGLVLHWKFEEGSGTTAVDSSGNGHHGTLTNMDAADWIGTGLPSVSGGTRYALDFDGSDDFVIASGDSFKGVTGKTSRTVAAWIKTTKMSACIANWGVNTGGLKWTFRAHDNSAAPGALRVEVNGGYQVGNTPIIDGNWHHVAAVLADHTAPNVNQLRLYVDGVLQGISVQLGQAINTGTTQVFRVANDFNNNRKFRGPIDDVRLYDHALSSADIRALAGVVDTYADEVTADNPVGYWRLGEDAADGARAFNEGSTGVPIDGIYRNVPGTAYGKPGLVDNGNDSVYLDGGDDRCEIPDNADINTGGPYTKKTIETWFRTDAFPDGTNRRVVFEQGAQSNGFNQFVRLVSGIYYLYYGAWHNNGAQVNHFPTRFTISANTTYHAVSVYNDVDNTFVLYVNGALAGGKQNANIESVPGHTGDNAIGAKEDQTRFDNSGSSGDGNRFMGYVDDVANYNDALTLERIQAHYAAGTGNRLGIMECATLGAALNYDATNDSDGNTTFEDSIGSRKNDTTAVFDWDLSGMTDSSRKSVSGGVLSRITYAYRFDGNDAVTTTSFESLAGNPSLRNATFELVFKPTDFTGTEVLLESGGTTDGMSITLDGSVLHFDVKDGGVSARPSYDLTGLPASEQASFIHVLGVADLDGDRGLLYVNGVLRNIGVAGGDLADCTGGDGAGLGSVNAAINFGSPSGFNGDIALLRFYPMLLDDTQVSQNYEALLSRGAVFLVK